MAQDFSAYIHVTGGTSGADYDLNFGFSPDATDGYDGDFDLYAPPAPPPPFLDAALQWEGDRYYSQILEGDADFSEHVYDIVLGYDTDNMINITWANPGWDLLMQSVMLQDAFGGGMINVDMANPVSGGMPEMWSLDTTDPANPILTLENPAFSTLKLKVTPANVGPFEGPTASFSVDPSNPSEVIAGSTLFTFTDSSTPGEASIGAWGWFFGDGTYSTDQNPTHIFQSAHSYQLL
jgi:PKD repeat protein